MATATKPDVYTLVTDRIIQALEEGTIPWQRPWVAGPNAPRNAVSNKAYRGLNALILSLNEQYQDQRYVTYKQASELGGVVRKGEHGTRVIFWKPNTYTNKDGEEKNGLILRFYTVFNVEQCDDLKKLKPLPTVREVDSIETAQAILDGFKSRPQTKFFSPEAYYVPTQDKVFLPDISQFVTPEGFYATAFHEYVHSTGHHTRLDRHLAEGGLGPFGSAPYSKEELVAEIGAAFLCAEAGIENATITNSSAYVASWLKVLKEDRKAVLYAASKAQAAADHILDRRVGE